MKRRIFTLLAALSLVIYLTSGALWLRSYSVADGLEWTTASAQWSIASDLGFFTSDVQTRSSRWPFTPVACHYIAHSPGDTIWVHQNANWFLGIRSVELLARDMAGTRIRIVNVPQWLVMAAATVLATPYLVMRSAWWLSRRRGPHGLCPECAYDLRATPDRCPECGAAVAEEPVKAI